MGRKDRRHGDGPPLDPFGAEDPAWERYHGISQHRVWARNRRRGQRDRMRRIWSEMPAALVAGALILAAMVGIVVLLFWGAAALID